MTKRAPTNLNTLYPTTADLIAMFAVEGLPTGFDCYYDNTSPPSGGGGGTSALNHYVFANSTNFFNTLKGEGFFTGGSPRLYYTPAVATALMAAGNVTYNGYSINLIEYHMRTEGVSTGCLGQSGTMHLAGDDDCTILANLQTEGYTTGAFEVASQADNALVDFECVDGRLYKSACVALWSKLITSGNQTVAPLTDIHGAAAMNEDTSKRTVVTFAAPVVLILSIESESDIDPQPHNFAAVALDGELVLSQTVAYNNAIHYQRIMRQILVSAGTHTLQFYFAHPGNSAAVNISMFAFRQGG